MKKYILLFILLLCISLSGPAAGEQRVIGVLTYLNLSEEEYAEYVLARIRVIDLLTADGYLQAVSSGLKANPAEDGIRVVFYESLGEMLMDLEAGKIDAFEVPQSTADYLCSRNPSMYQPYRFDKSYQNRFEAIITERMSDGFAFMLMEYNRGLRDQFNTVIREMKEDGTIEKLIRDHIESMVNGEKAPSVIPEQKEGRETLTIAITGSMPPMDYVGPDGNFSGFNAAILAEIGRRLDKNMELLQVDSIGRAMALASGTVDAAFWTRGTPNPQISEMSDEEYAAMVEEYKAVYSEDENEVMRTLSEALSRIKLDRRDLPDGTISTDPYFLDISVPVARRQN